MTAIEHLSSVRAVQAWLQQHARAGAVLQSDSRKVQPGDVFLAWAGHAHDGRMHIPAALQAGAAAVVVDALPSESADFYVDGAVPLASFNGLYRASGAIASAWYGMPSQLMDVVAITGTNGKTTCAWWLSHALSEACKLCGYVGTLGIGVGDDVQLSGLTSPEALQLQHALFEMHENGVQACAVEASSIGLDQGRLNGLSINVAVLTNFTQDHLDYHHSMQAYGQAKRLLFAWPGLRAAVINVQDAFGQVLAQELSDEGALDLWSVAVHAEGLSETPARLQASSVLFAPGLAHFVVTENDPAGRQRLDQVEVQAPIVGLYNVQNALAVLAALRALGYPLVDAAALLAQVPAVDGRMQMVQEQGKPLVVVDYAHTADALQSALTALRPVAQQRGGQLTVVFGCGGDRDSSKRPLMAMAAARHADTLWITSDNPRSENPLNIIEQVSVGLTPAQRARAHITVDRAQAIQDAVRDASAQDVILIAGKGHEAYQEIKGVKHPFSDLQQAQDALAGWHAIQAVSPQKGVSA
ncbi:UDP-N-acetylmuramoyl-L-alanyl-D-glutamate--2,6-diaminopimelate ligase [Lampropedia puyangensis]|uniref:UDP-N-acetylmuramoyl-L-alanyl-D-glutamate--2,6-diaminopimelate ligase n=1 Tax=Lampropedia puyangensis TaxID=1330072 RepID=A0A4S8EVQ6_9BURK|nr:UDP-N-acetylmuramoyl-L-alanyl-D-glutamate--2,6-diaminopimelate ligase [Lampropedia puyangensis]THT96471.1 UDP-N-acetylmuramoyl-L-alanyl-D-glutamate--2,6-diaminopimelate ligase [Lampropedia puyangensis]